MHSRAVSVAPAAYDFSADSFSQNIPQFERFLGELKHTPCRLLEIGAHEGRSATWLIDNIATHPSATVDTIDAYEKPRLQHNLAATGHREKVTFHAGFSAVVLPTLPLDSYDFAYIDGNHWAVNVLEDAVLSFRLVKVGGIMAFDDYLWDDPEWNHEGRPKEAIDAFLTIYSMQIEILYRGYQVWIRKTTARCNRDRHRLDEIAVLRAAAVLSPKWLLRLHPRQRLNAFLRRLKAIN